jgi:hypothetical protein
VVVCVMCVWVGVVVVVVVGGGVMVEGLSHTPLHRFPFPQGNGPNLRVIFYATLAITAPRAMFMVPCDVAVVTASGVAAGPDAGSMGCLGDRYSLPPE